MIRSITFHFFSLLTLLQILGGCGSVQKFPGARFSTPETNGIGLTKVETGVAHSRKLQPSTDLRTSPVSEDPLLSKSISPFIAPSFGFTDWLDLEINLGPSQALDSQIKIQFLGSPASGAGAGSFSLAFNIGYSIYVAADEIASEDILAANKEARSIIVNSGMTKMSMSTGYRFIAPLLVFVGVYKDSGRYTLKIKEGERTTIVHEIEDFGTFLGMTYQMGALFSTLTFSQGEFEITNRTNKLDSLAYSFSVGLRF